jgi:hypothetical protein
VLRRSVPLPACALRLRCRGARIAKGAQLVAVDSQAPITAASDMCLVKLLVGPGVTAEKDRRASYSEGIGIEVWLPAHAAWNERIRNYGGGGWVGGGHRYARPDRQQGAGHRQRQHGLRLGHARRRPAALPGPVLRLPLQRQAQRRRLPRHGVASIYEQAVKTRALVRPVLRPAPRFAYYDGHSQGGRQGLKVAQEWPELYDGYLIAQPAINVPKFGLASFYPQW